MPCHDWKTCVSHVDGCVIAVPTAGKQACVDLARKTDAMFIEHGALRVLEGDDVRNGKLTDSRRAVQARPDGTVVFFGGSSGRTRTPAMREWPK